MAGQPVDVKLFNKWSFEDIEVSMLAVEVLRRQPAALAHGRVGSHHRGGCSLCFLTAWGSGADVQLSVCRSVTLLWRTTSLSSPSLQCMCPTQQAATRSGASARPSAPLWRGGCCFRLLQQAQLAPDLLPWAQARACRHPEHPAAAVTAVAAAVTARSCACFALLL